MGFDVETTAKTSAARRDSRTHQYAGTSTRRRRTQSKSIQLLASGTEVRFSLPLDANSRSYTHGK